MITRTSTSPGLAEPSNSGADPSRVRRILDLALPMIAAALATNLMGFVDTLMVGRLGDAALGGVGIGGQLFFLLLATGLGLTAGVQALVARRVGEGRVKETGKVLNAGILLAVVVAVVLMSLAYPLMSVVFGAINADPLINAAGLDYLATRLPSLLFMGLTLVFRSYWIGVSQAGLSMIAILTLSLANVLFNYMLIFGNFGAPRMGVAGAGLGSTLAVLVGLLVNLGFALRFASGNGFLRGLPDATHIRTLLRISAPESVRQILFSIGVVVMYMLIGRIGMRELAAFHVVISICLIAYLPHIGIGGAATTLVGEALGRKDTRDAMAWGWQVSNFGLLVLTGLGIAVASFPQLILRLFLVDEGTLAIAIIPLQLAVFAHVLDGYGKILGAALIGAGATRVAMRLTLLPQWLLLLPLLALTVSLGFGLREAMAVFIGSVAVAALLMAWAWRGAQWAELEL